MDIYLLYCLIWIVTSCDSSCDTIISEIASKFGFRWIYIDLIALYSKSHHVIDHVILSYLKSPWNLESDEYKFMLLPYMASLITWLIMWWDSHRKIVQLCLFNHVNPSSISSVITFTMFSFCEIWLSPTFFERWNFLPNCQAIQKRL